MQKAAATGSGLFLRMGGRIISAPTQLDGAMTFPPQGGRWPAGPDEGSCRWLTPGGQHWEDDVRSHVTVFRARAPAGQSTSR